MPVPFQSEVQIRPRAAALRILIAGDHAVLRTSLKTMLELDPQIRVVGEAGDDCEAIKMARRLRPDIVLMDLDMRCCSGFEAVSEIRSGRLASAVFGLTIHECKRERDEATRAGVDVVLEKGVPYKELIGALRAYADAPTR